MKEKLISQTIPFIKYRLQHLEGLILILFPTEELLHVCVCVCVCVCVYIYIYIKYVNDGCYSLVHHTYQLEAIYPFRTFYRMIIAWKKLSHSVHWVNVWNKCRRSELEERRKWRKMEGHIEILERTESAMSEVKEYNSVINIGRYPQGHNHMLQSFNWDDVFGFWHIQKDI